MEPRGARASCVTVPRRRSSWSAASAGAARRHARRATVIGADVWARLPVVALFDAVALHFVAGVSGNAATGADLVYVVAIGPGRNPADTIRRNDAVVLSLRALARELRPR